MTPRFVLAVLIAAVMSSGCQQQEFPGGGIYAVAMDSTTPAFFTARDSAIYIIERRIDLPILAPTPEQMAALAAMPAPAPFPSMPWVLRNDIATELQYTLSNLEDHPVRVAITFNGYNEFDEFVPLASIVEDNAVADYSNYEWTVVLPAGARYNGTIRDQKIDQSAVALATIGNLTTNPSMTAPNDNTVNYPENQPERDPRIMPYVPTVVPGLVGFRLGLRVVGDPPAAGATSGGAPKVVLEATVRVQSSTGKLLDAHNLDPAYVAAHPAFATTVTPRVISPAPPPAP